MQKLIFSSNKAVPYGLWKTKTKTNEFWDFWFSEKKIKNEHSFFAFWTFLTSEKSKISEFVRFCFCFSQPIRNGLTVRNQQPFLFRMAHFDLRNTLIFRMKICHPIFFFFSDDPFSDAVRNGLRCTFSKLAILMSK